MAKTRTLLSEALEELYSTTDSDKYSSPFDQDFDEPDFDNKEEKEILLEVDPLDQDEIEEDMEEATDDDPKDLSALNTIVDSMFDESLTEGIFSTIGSIVKDKFKRLVDKFETVLAIKVYDSNYSVKMVDMVNETITEKLEKIAQQFNLELTSPYFGRYMNDAKAAKAVFDLCKDTKCTIYEAQKSVLSEIIDDYLTENDINATITTRGGINKELTVDLKFTTNEAFMNFLKNNPDAQAIHSAVGSLLDKYCQVVNHTDKVSYGHYKTKDNAINFIVNKAIEENDPQAFITYTRLVAEELEPATEEFTEAKGLAEGNFWGGNDDDSEVAYVQVRGYDTEEDFKNGDASMIEAADDEEAFFNDCKEDVDNGTFYAIVMGDFSCKYDEEEVEYDDKFTPTKVYPEGLDTSHLLVETVNEAVQLKEYKSWQSAADELDQGHYYNVPDWYYQQLGYDDREDFLRCLAAKRERQRRQRTWQKYYGQYLGDFEYTNSEDEKAARTAFRDKLNEEGLVDSDLFHKGYDGYLDALFDHLRDKNKILFTEDDIFDDNGDIKYNKLKTIKNMVPPNHTIYKVLDSIITAKEAGKIKNLPEEKPAQASAPKAAATKDYTDDVAVKDFWAKAKLGTLDYAVFHKAFDDALAQAGIDVNDPNNGIFNTNGELVNRGCYGKIKQLDDSLASVRALKKLWGLAFSNK